MSSDQIDQACEREEQDRALSQTYRKPEGPAPIGICLSCGVSVGPGMRWCDAECRDEWQTRQRLNRAALRG